jgi:hypothetical protein
MYAGPPREKMQGCFGAWEQAQTSLKIQDLS